MYTVDSQAVQWCTWLLVAGNVSGVSNVTGQSKKLIYGDLVFDGETYGCVNSFCYLGDTIDGDGVADFSVTSRIKNGWMKFRELLPFQESRAHTLEVKGRMKTSCFRRSMTYGGETRPLLADVGLKLERAEKQMIRWMCGVSMKDRRTSEELRKLVVGGRPR